MVELRDATYWVEEINRGRVSPTELLELTAEKIERLNPKYNAIVASDLERARQDLKQTKHGLFAGLPLPLKMLGQSHVGLPDTAGSQIFKDNIASNDSAFVVKLMEAGFTPFGQTNTPEFGFKNITDPKLYGPTRNVWNPAYYSGGSSGGAASAVAAGIYPMAAGSDGGGSLRIPASFSGLLGFKVTRGRMPQGPSGFRSWQGASTSGALTVSVRDMARFLAVSQTVQEAAPYQTPLLSKDRLLDIHESRKRLKVAFSLATPINGIEVSETAKLAVQKTIGYLAEQGHEIVEVAYPMDTRGLIESYYQMNAAETAAMLRPYEQAIGREIAVDEIEPLSFALLNVGRKISAINYIEILNSWDQATAVFEERIFSEFDIFITPTSAQTAPKITDDLVPDAVRDAISNIKALSFAEQTQAISAYFEPSLAITPYPFTANLTGQPVLSVPVFVDQQSGLPQGVQLWGAKNSEITILELAKELENGGQFILPAAYRS